MPAMTQRRENQWQRLRIATGPRREWVDLARFALDGVDIWPALHHGAREEAKTVVSPWRRESAGSAIRAAGWLLHALAHWARCEQWLYVHRRSGRYDMSALDDLDFRRYIGAWIVSAGRPSLKMTAADVQQLCRLTGAAPLAHPALPVGRTYPDPPPRRKPRPASDTTPAQEATEPRSKPADEPDPLRDMRAHFVKCGQTNYALWGAVGGGDALSSGELYGWRKPATIVRITAAGRVDKANTGWVYYAHKDAFRRVVCGGHDWRRCVELLKSRGLLVLGPNGGRADTHAKPPGSRHATVYRVKSAIVDAGHE